MIIISDGLDNSREFPAFSTSKKTWPYFFQCEIHRSSGFFFGNCFLFFGGFRISKCPDIAMEHGQL